MKQYTSLDAREILGRGRKVYGWQAPIHLLLRPMWKLVEKYLLQQGFREGIHGLILSCMAAIGVFLIYVFSWQLQKEALHPEKEAL